MKMNISKTTRSILTPILFVAGLFVALQVQAKAINMASFLGAESGDSISFTNDIVSEATTNWFKKGVRIGQQGTGGVTFFNGTIVNETTTNGGDNPITVGDQLRVDGTIYRGAKSGKAGDALPVKIDDNAQVVGSLTVEDAVTMSSNAAVKKNLTVTGTSTLTDAVTASGDITVADDLTAKDLIVTGTSDFTGTMDLTGVDITGFARPFDAIIATDGSGDFTTIEAALNASKICLFVKNGTYTPATDLTFPSGGCLIGESQEKTVIDYNGGNFQIIVKGTSAAVTVEQVRMENFSIRESADTAGAIFWEFVGNSRLRNVTIGSNTTMGLHLKDASLSVIEGNRITANSGDGIYLETSNFRNIISGNVIYSNTGDGIQVDGSEGTEDSTYNALNNNLLSANSGNGFFLRGADFSVLGGNIATGNTLDGVDVAALGTDTAQENVVTGNQLNGNTVNALDDNGASTVSSGNAT